MPYHLFQYPLPAPAELTDLNTFLSAQRVVSVTHHIAATPSGSMLVFVVQTIHGGPSSKERSSNARKIDYRETLSPPEFERFSRLREERKKIAEAEGVPVYAVFTNEQLAELARRNPSERTEIEAIPGIGKARVDKHGERLLKILQETRPDTPPSSPITTSHSRS